MSILTADFSPRRLALLRAGCPSPLVVHNAPVDARAYIHPLLAPDGEGALTENEPLHHAWQHGLYVGLNLVNGFGFWTEGKLPGHGPDGTFHPQPMAAPIINGCTASWTVKSAWRDPAGQTLLEETQDWRFEDRGVSTLLDLNWTLTACINLQFGRHAYGGLFLRMPWRAETGGEICTSEGARTIIDAEGRTARWVALAMPLPDRNNGPAGMALLDHPSNPLYPSPWRVDGNLGIAPSRCIAGAWQLAAGDATCSRYRAITYTGAIDPDRIERAWREFSRA